MLFEQQRWDFLDGNTSPTRCRQIFVTGEVVFTKLLPDRGRLLALAGTGQSRTKAFTLIADRRIQYVLSGIR